MREIKFRAWDDVAKRMSYSNTEQFDDMLGFRFDHFETDKPIYMQYTGLKDKNGKEIYEGDILRLVLVDYAHVPEQIFVVSSDSFFEDVCYLQNISRFVEDSGSETDGIEVIGNIYESPERDMTNDKKAPLWQKSKKMTEQQTPDREKMIAEIREGYKYERDDNFTYK